MNRYRPKILRFVNGYIVNKLIWKMKNIIYFILQIYFLEDLGFSYMNVPVQSDIKLAMLKALQHFKSNGLHVEEAKFKNLHETLEMGLALFFNLDDPPALLTHPDNPDLPDDNVYLECLKSLIGQSKYTFAALIFYLMVDMRAFLPKHKVPIYVEKSKIVRQQFLV